MNFDAVIGNPPYGRGLDIDFVSCGYELCSKYVCMIIPAKWQTAEENQHIASEMSYGEFRSKLVQHMSHVVFYPDCRDIFDIYQVDGLTYFLLDKGKLYERVTLINKCSNIECFNSVNFRSISRMESLLNIGNEIIESLGKYNQFKFQAVNGTKRYRVYMNTKISGFDWFQTRKPRYVLGLSRVVDTYRGEAYDGESKVVFESDLLNECLSFLSWINTKFTRFFLIPNVSKLNNIQTDHYFRFVPEPTVLDEQGNRVKGKFDHLYTDSEIYKTFGICQNYIDIIESLVKERK